MGKRFKHAITSHYDRAVKHFERERKAKSPNPTAAYYSGVSALEAHIQKQVNPNTGETISPTLSRSMARCAAFEHRRGKKLGDSIRKAADSYLFGDYLLEDLADIIGSHYASVRKAEMTKSKEGRQLHEDHARYFLETFNDLLGAQLANQGLAEDEIAEVKPLVLDELEKIRTGIAGRCWKGYHIQRAISRALKARKQ